MPSLPLTSNIQALAPGLTAEDLRMVLPKPEVTPKRSEDMPGPGGLMVLGRMERGNNLPLHLHPLRHLLSNDGALPKDTGRLHCALEASLCEVWRFCEEHSWLSEVRSFIQSWSLEILEKLRGGAAPEYEDVIQRVQTWQERVLCVKESITTPAFMVSCLPISRQLALPLADIMQDLLLSLTSEVSHRSQSLMEELNQVMEIFQSVKTDIPSFTEFTKKVDTYTQSSASLQFRMDHVLSLKTIIRMNIRSPSPEEETLHCQLMETWDHFHQHLKNASEFLNINRFSMLASLEQSFLSCYSEADRVIEAAQAPMFLDPSQDSRQVLKELKDMCCVLHTLTIELRDLSCSRQALQGKTFDILRISQGEKELRGREAAWKLLERSTEQITEWKRMPFIKVNADRMKEKLSGWESSLHDITLVLPDDDPVICRVKDILRDFSQHIPLLQALGNSALKPKHWEAIFTGMGWRFPGLETLNVGDLLMFPLLQHQDEIQKARLRAEAEVTSVQTFRKLQATWQERQFHLAKLFLHVKPRGPAVDRSCRPPSGRFREAQEQVQVMDSGAVVLMDTLSLCSLLDDSLLSLRVMMTSPTLPPDLQDELNDWTHRLEELDRHVDLWIQFQEKWVFITKVRNEIEPLPAAGTEMTLFQEVDQDYRSFLSRMVQDPFVFSLVRPLPGRFGENLCSSFRTGIGMLERVLADMKHQLDTSRSLFPRFCFLSDKDLMHILSSPSSHDSYTHSALLCFPSLTNVLYGGQANRTTATMDSSQTLTTGVEGICGERLYLASHISGSLSLTSWLSKLEQELTRSVMYQLELCLTEHERLELFNSEFSKLLADQVAIYPWQCLVVREELLWCEEVEADLFSTRRESLKERHSQKLGVLLQRLKNPDRTDLLPREAIQRSRAILSAWIALVAMQRDRVSSLLDENIDSFETFAWAKILKYRAIAEPCETIEHTTRNPRERSDGTGESLCVVVDILGFRLPYEYEYTGVDGSIMYSTFSDRCTLGLLLALDQYQCGTVIGQDEESRTHSVVALGRALGRHIVILKCWGGINLNRLSQYLQGALQGGAWLVLDCADRLKREVQSSLGHLLGHIQACCKSLKDSGSNLPSEQLLTKVVGHIQFEGRSVPVGRSYGCFMTLPHIHPSSELPSSLRLNLRPVSLLTPDLHVTALLALLSYGFEKTEQLARKISCFFQLAVESGAVGSRYCSFLMRRVIHTAASFMRVDASCDNAEDTKDNNILPGNQAPASHDGQPTGGPSSPLPKGDSIYFQEEQWLVNAIYTCSFWLNLSSMDCNYLREILQSVFPMGTSQEFLTEPHMELIGSIKFVLQEAGLEAHADLQLSALQLYQALQQSSCVLLTGGPGSGKSTCWRVLSLALNHLSNSAEWPGDMEAKQDSSSHRYKAIKTVHLYPNSLTIGELFGEECDGSWTEGIFSRILLRTPQESKRQKWLVLDGTVSPYWAEPMSCLSGAYPTLTLSSGEHLGLPESMKIICEVGDTSSITPAMATLCGFIHCGGEDTWRSILGAFISTMHVKYRMTLDTVGLLENLSCCLVVSTLTFLETSCSSALHPHTVRPAESARGVAQVSSFCNILQALLDQYLLRDHWPSAFKTQEITEEPNGQGDRVHRGDVKDPLLKVTENIRKKITGNFEASSLDHLIPPHSPHLSQSCFIFAFIWGFAGNLDLRHRPMFSAFLRARLGESCLTLDVPGDVSVFELSLDPDVGILVPSPSPAKEPTRRTGFPLQMENVRFIVRCLVQSDRPVLLVGSPGSGKTSLGQSLTLEGSPSRRIAFNSLLRPAQLRQLLHLPKNAVATSLSVRGRKGPRLIFLDDLHEARHEPRSRVSPLLEAVRAVLSDLVNRGSARAPCQSFVGTTSSACDGAVCLCPRLTRLFCVLVLPDCEPDSLVSLFAARLTPWLKVLPPPRAQSLGAAIARVTVDLYKEVKRALPAHYCFSLHHLHRLIAGMTSLCATPGPHLCPLPDHSLSSAQLTTLGTARLWMHEALRTFSDILVDHTEKAEFRELLRSCARNAFCRRAPRDGDVEDSPQDTSVRPGTRQEDTETELNGSSNQKRSTDSHDTPPYTPRIHKRSTDLHDIPPYTPRIQKRSTDSHDTPHTPRIQKRSTDSYDTPHILRIQERSTDSHDTPHTPNIHERSTGSQDTSHTPIIQERSTDSPHTPRIQERHTDFPHTHKSQERSTDSHDKPPHTPSSQERSTDSHDKPPHSPSSQERSTDSHDTPPHTPSSQERSTDSRDTPPHTPSSQERSTDSHDTPPHTPSSQERSTDSHDTPPHTPSSQERSTDSHDTPHAPSSASASEGYLIPLHLVSEESLQDLTFCHSLCGTQHRAEIPVYKEQPGASKEDSTLILCPQDLQHIARLTRVLLLPQGHLALLSQQPATGRRSLARLAARLTQCSLRELSNTQSSAERHALYRELSYTAGVLGTPTAVLVHEEPAERALLELSALAREGTFIGLYQEEQECQVLKDMQQNERSKRRFSMEALQERFCQRVRRNLHILLLQNTAQKLQIQNFPLGRWINTDQYEPWSLDSLQYIAHKLLGEAGHQLCGSWTSPTALPLAMSLIHLSGRSYCLRFSPRTPLTSPGVFINFIQTFLRVLVCMKQHVQMEGERLRDALSRVQELEDEHNRCLKDFADATQRLQDTEKDVQHWRHQLGMVQGALQRVRDQCQALDNLKEYTDAQVKNVTNQKLREVEEAQLRWSAVQDGLKVSDVEEIRRYRAPPPLVVMVTDALCAIFEKEPGWESAKRLLGQEEFHQMLEFYDVRAMSSVSFSALTRAVTGPTFNVDSVRPASAAAASLCQWLRGLQRYSSFLRRLHSEKALLSDLEEQDMQVAEGITSRKLQEDKLRKMEAQSVQSLQEAERKEEALQQELSQLQQRYKAVQECVSRAGPHASKWRDALQAHSRRALMASSEAVLVAASISYLGALPWSRVVELLDKWQNLIQGVVVSLDPDDVKAALERLPYYEGTGTAPRLLDMLSTPSERLIWHRQRLFIDAESQTRASFLRATGRFSRSRPTLLIDPGQRGETWLRALLGELDLEHGSTTRPHARSSSTGPEHNVTSYGKSWSAPENTTKLCVTDSSDGALREGIRLVQRNDTWLLVTHVERNPTAVKMMCGIGSPADDDLTTSARPETQTPTSHIQPEMFKAGFHVFFSTFLPLSALIAELGASFIKEVNVIDMSLGSSGLEEELLQEVLLFKEARLQEQRNSLHLNALQLQEDLHQTELSLLDFAASTQRPLLCCDDFVPQVSECEEEQKALLQMVKDVESVQSQIKESLRPYFAAVASWRLLFTKLQELSRLSLRYHFPAESVMRWAHKALRDIEGTCAAEDIFQVEAQVTRAILSHVIPALTQEHRHILQVLLAVGKTSPMEWLSFLGLAHTSWQGVLSSCIQRPTWVDPQAWEELGHLENLPIFRGIRSSLSVQASQWQEYFHLHSTVIGSVPCSQFAHLSQFHTAILWRILRPQRMGMVLAHLISCLLGPVKAEWSEEEEDLLNLTDPSTPTLYLLPGVGSPGPHSHPLPYILRLAEKKKKEVQVLAWGHFDPSVTARGVITRCQRGGHWLLLHNGDGVVCEPSMADSLAGMRSSNDPVDPDFRLWIIIQEEALNSLPAHVRLASLLVPCAPIPHLRSALLQSCRDSAELLEGEAQSKEALQLLILHSILLRRQGYSRAAQAEIYSWNQEELNLSLHVMKRLTSVCEDWEDAVQFITGSVIYGGHIVDDGDAESVLAVTRHCLREHQLVSRGISNLLSALDETTSSGPWAQSLHRHIQNGSSLWEPSALGLSEGLQSASHENCGCKAMSDLLITQDFWTNNSIKHPNLTSCHHNIPGAMRSTLTPIPPATDTSPSCYGERPANRLSQSLELLSNLNALYLSKQRELESIWLLQRGERCQDNAETHKEGLSRKEQQIGAAMGNLVQEKQKSEERHQENQMEPVGESLQKLDDGAHHGKMEGRHDTGEASCCTAGQNPPISPIKRCEDDNCRRSLPGEKGSLLLGFLLAEWDSLRELIQRAVQELTEALSDCRCQRCLGVRKAVLGGFLPQEWSVYPSAPPAGPVELIQGLHIRMKLLFGYLSTPHHNTYNLSVFQRPARFLQQILMERARTEDRSLEAYSLHLQVSQRVPADGFAVILTGVHLRHALWDTRRGLLQHTLSPKLCPLPPIQAWAVLGNRTPLPPCASHYMCPLYSQDSGAARQRSQAIVQLPLPSCIPPAVWIQRRVHAVSLL
uniref:Dynein heavy chain domain-containing protein 1 n=1 Tax=Leptobrachium leishanense TaxID=445787 RepID=A0A8C5MR28_9ANUR